MRKFQGLAVFALILAFLAPVPAALAARKKKSVPGRETAADLRRREQDTRREISRTREQIKENDRAVQKNLNELTKLQEDIGAGKKRVADAGQKVKALKSDIDRLQTKIASEKKQLDRLRSEYLASVRKMRVRRKEKSTLAFLFSAGSFSEAMRRMRYLRQFSEWRKKKTAEISGRVAGLKAESDRLAKTKVIHDRALAESVNAQKQLQTQYARQDAIVVELKRNGQALQSHLARKQSEANALNNRVASLIAEEQRKAEQQRLAEQKRVEEQRRLAEQKRIEEQRLAEAREEAEKKAADEKRRKEAELLADNNSKQKSGATGAKRNAGKSESTAKKEERKTRKSNAKESKDSRMVNGKDKNVSYAEARKRKPRSGTDNPSSSAAGDVASKKKTVADKGSASTSPASGSFESMKGSLPRPVAGHFRVTGRFGTHSLPDMPNVSYDNPGIDAEVSKGATAQAVYSGTVSGVYMVPGYATVIIVSHDGYYTVYGNIESAAVKVGDKVRQGQKLGRLGADADNPGHSLIHFEVWKNRTKQDPMAWIR